ncbi:uncharacterized protein C8Q71DRAFT_858601 [Rhodofomes roseus]|uniref:Uncharacterized protein n=1 Tax=Rhodofomes roseus TaxID=34475 RepID=A0ABQ8KDM4_9APHY|nr:uncharacterized protein C8Q71DRAFT_858601 [Rhodofomes roseus]KAH9835752.1 hypothetical protein C8Q71DRAFT_858601 [Rhodofomes roseus]
MLKRQRPSSPIPMAAEAPLAAEPPFDIDLAERVAKRARHFAPLRRSSYAQKNAVVLGPDTDGEEEQEDDGRSEYTRGQTQWQEKAGLYKNANTLLHDLHAEQRHRHLFAAGPSNPPHPQRHPHHPMSSNPPPSMELRHPRGIAMPQPSAGGPSYHTSSHAHGSTEQVEARIVTSQYEDTNRFLRDLFLNRRRRLGAEQT